MKYQTTSFIVVSAAIFLLSLLYATTKEVKIFPEGTKNNRASCVDFSTGRPLRLQFTASSLAEFEKYLGNPQRVFHGSKDQILLHMKLTDGKGKRHDLFFLDTGAQPCIVKSGERYFKIPRSAEEMRVYIQKFQIDSE